MDDTFLPTTNKLKATVMFLGCIVIALWLQKTVESVRNQQIIEIISVDESAGNKFNESVNEMETVGSSFVKGENETEIQEVYYLFLVIKWLTFIILSYICACLLFQRLNI